MTSSSGLPPGLAPGSLPPGAFNPRGGSVPVPPDGFPGLPPGAVPPGGFIPTPPPQIGPDGEPIIPGGPAPTIQDWQGGIDRLFSAAFGRAPDLGGRDFWVDQTNNNGLGFDQVAENFLRSPEGIRRFAPEAPNRDFCRNLYENVLGRLPDDEGLDFWVDQLDKGTLTQAEMLIDFANSQENIKNTDELGFDEASIFAGLNWTEINL